MKSIKFLALSFAVTGALFLGGCANSQKAGTYQTGLVQQSMKIKLGTVIDVREVQIEAQNSSVGTTTGAMVGATAGSLGGRNGVVQGIAGAVVGGVAGSLAEKAVSQKIGVEITYQIDGSKDLEAMVQEKDEQDIKPGDRIRLVQSAFNVRAVKISQGPK